MKVAIVLSSNYYKSNSWIYTFILKNENIDFKIITWNRVGIDEKDVIAFNFNESEDKGYFKRYLSYVKYRDFVVNELDKNVYDRVIVSTIAIGIILLPYLLEKYKRKYIFDIRDRSIVAEIFKNRFKSLIFYSFETVISSEGFKKWMPKNISYKLSHNFPYEHFNFKKRHIDFRDRINGSTQVKLTTIGSLRDYDVNSYLINQFKNKISFYLSFVGEGPASERLKEFAQKANVSNIEFAGRFQQGDEKELLKDSTILNLLTSNDLNSLTLTTNRFYLSALLGIPMLVYSDTFQGKLCRRYKLGCVVDRDSNIYDKLFIYICSFNFEEFKNGCISFLNIVHDDTCKLEDCMKDFVNIR